MMLILENDIDVLHLHSGETPLNSDAAIMNDVVYRPAPSGAGRLTGVSL